MAGISKAFCTISKSAYCCCSSRQQLSRIPINVTVKIENRRKWYIVQKSAKEFNKGQNQRIRFYAVSSMPRFSNFSVTTETTFPSTVNAGWLSENLKDETVKILDASWYMPNSGKDPTADFSKARIPGASFFNIDEVADRSIALPHMLPSARQFAAAADALGIKETDKVVVYDGSGIFSSARAWWMFKIFGHQQVAVLDGGLPAWREFGGKMDETEIADVNKINKASVAAQNINLDTEPSYKAVLNSFLVKELKDMVENIEKKEFQVIDARSAERFNAEVPEVRKGLKAGHIPGSKNVHYEKVLNNGYLEDTVNLRSVFSKRGLNFEKPIVASCGIGVTAAILVLALDKIGVKNVAIYDGSWTEYGSAPDVPIAP